MKRELILIFCIVILSGFFVDAEIIIPEDNSSSIQETYTQSSNLIGWINISLDREFKDSIVEADFGNVKSSVNLVQFLEMAGFSNNGGYNCSPIDCENSYSTVSGSSVTTKTIAAEKDNQYLLGFSFDKNMNEIKSIEFNATSGFEASSCNNQLKIDLFADGSFDYVNRNIFNGSSPGDEVCSITLNRGCFNPDAQNLKENIIDGTGFCQRFNLAEAPALRVGAVIKGTGENDFRMSVYSREDLQPRGSCTFPVTSTTGYESRSCDTTTYIEGGEYYVCMKRSTGDSQYLVRADISSSKCGYVGLQSTSTEETAAFDMFAQTKKFGTVGTISTKSISNYNFGLNAKNYITEKYGDLNCNDYGGCVIPFILTSGEDQSIGTSALSAVFKEESDLIPPDETINQFHNLNTTSARINSDFIRIPLDNTNLSVPSASGNYELNLKIGGEEVLSQNILVEEISQINYLTPRTAIAAYPIEFTVKTSSPELLSNATKFTWSFGDGKNQTTTGNSVEHAYEKIGTFPLKITIGQGNFSSSRTFQINVTTPREAVETVLEEKISGLERVKASISSYTSFEKSTIENVLNLSEVEEKISELQISKANAVGDQDYVNIMKELIKLVVPGEVYVSLDSVPLIYFPEKKVIKPEVIGEAGFGTYDSGRKEDYIDSLLLWNINNIVTRTTIKEFSGSFGEGAEDKIASTLSINVQNKIPGNYYLVLPKMENVIFKADYSKKETSSNYILELTGENNLIELSTSSDISPETLSLFLSPNLGELQIRTQTVNVEEATKQGLLILSLILLVLFGFVAYLVMREWYKRRYEHYLFPNKNDLYNIASYIEGAKKKGESVNDISDRLKKAGWNSEQLTYVIKKYLGKRTGVPELPFVTRIVDMIFGGDSKGSANNAKT